VSKTRNYLDTILFVRSILKFCSNKPKILVDGGRCIHGRCRDWDWNLKGLNSDRTFASIFKYNDIAFMIRYFYHNILLFFE